MPPRLLGLQNINPRCKTLSWLQEFLYFTACRVSKNNLNSIFYDHPVFPDNISFRRAVCKEQTLSKYTQCLFSYSYIRRDIIFLTFPVLPLVLQQYLSTFSQLSPLIFTSLLTDVHPRRHNILTLFIYRMPCNFCCTGRNIHVLICTYLAYRKMSVLYLTFLAPFPFRLMPRSYFEQFP